MKRGLKIVSKDFFVINKIRIKKYEFNEIGINEFCIKKNWTEIFA